MYSNRERERRERGEREERERESDIVGRRKGERGPRKGERERLCVK